MINPNWSIQIIDHWRDPLDTIRCEILNNGSEELNKIIYNDILNNITELLDAPENAIFLKDEWTCIRKIKDAILI